MLSIPKIIHQTWKNNDIPEKWLPSYNAWRRFQPDYEYKLWTDEDNRNFLMQNFPWALELYDSLPYHIQRVDMIRYFILYYFGGIYCDLDLEPLTSFDSFFEQDNNELYLVRSPNLRCVTNSFMASREKSPFWIHVLHELERSVKHPKWWWIGKHLIVMNTTGPVMLDRAVASYTQSSIAFFPENTLPCDVCGASRFKETRMRTLGGGSWHELDSWLYNHAYCYRDVLLVVLLAGICMFVYFWFHYRACCRRSCKSIRLTN